MIRDLLDSGRLINVAHRGARSLAPENTLVAARLGLDAGADLWELDLALSRDLVPVVVHDDTLTRTSNAAEIFPGRSPWPVEAFSLDRLSSLTEGSIDGRLQDLRGMMNVD